jgi:hypothetical protein
MYVFAGAALITTMGLFFHVCPNANVQISDVDVAPDDVRSQALALPEHLMSNVTRRYPGVSL